MKGRLPDTQQQWWQLAGIQVPGITSLPVLLLGQSLLKNMSLASYIVGVIAGNTLLWACGLCIVLMGEKKRQNIAQLSRNHLLKVGGFIAAIGLLATSLTWFSLQLHASASAMFHLFSPSLTDRSVLGVRIGVIFGITVSLYSLLGIRGIKWFNCIAAIPLIIFVTAVVIANATPLPPHLTQGPFQIHAMFLTMTVALPATFAMPTYFRHSRSRKDSLIGLSIFYILLAATELAGLPIASKVVQGQVWLLIPQQLELHSFLFTSWLSYTIVSAIGVLLLNTYAGSVGWELLVPKVVGRKEYIIVALGATLAFVLVQSQTLLTQSAAIWTLVVAIIGACLVCLYLISLSSQQAISPTLKRIATIAMLVGISGALLTPTTIGILHPYAIAIGTGTSAIIIVFGYLALALLLPPFHNEAQ